MTDDGVELVWTSHPNKLKTEEFEWLQGDLFGVGRDLLALLEVGIYLISNLDVRLNATSRKAMF